MLKLKKKKRKEGVKRERRETNKEKLQQPKAGRGVVGRGGRGEAVRDGC